MIRFLILLILIIVTLAFAAIIALQPARPAIIPGTLYSTWKAAK